MWWSTSLKEPEFTDPTFIWVCDNVVVYSVTPNMVFAYNPINIPPVGAFVTKGDVKYIVTGVDINMDILYKDSMSVAYAHRHIPVVTVVLEKK